jgi:hypothetical protein
MKVKNGWQLLGLIAAVAVVTAIVSSPNSAGTISGLGKAFSSILTGAKGGGS